MPFHITLRRTFCASHQLRLSGGAPEPLHGHNWHLSLVVARADGGLDEIETVVDFHEIEAALDAVTGPMHNRHLNDLPAFADRNPSAERVAEHVGRAVALPAGVRVVACEVTEAQGCSATWTAEPR